jgi:hypothetical protein
MKLSRKQYNVFAKLLAKEAHRCEAARINDDTTLIDRSHSARAVRRVNNAATIKFVTIEKLRYIDIGVYSFVARYVTEHCPTNQSSAVYYKRVMLSTELTPEQQSYLALFARKHGIALG